MNQYDVILTAKTHINRTVIAVLHAPHPVIVTWSQRKLKEPLWLSNVNGDHNNSSLTVPGSFDEEWIGKQTEMHREAVLVSQFHDSPYVGLYI